MGIRCPYFDIGTSEPVKASVWNMCSTVVLSCHQSCLPDHACSDHMTNQPSSLLKSEKKEPCQSP